MALEHFRKFQGQEISFSKVSVQGVVALVSHFATFCQGVDSNEAYFFSLIFEKKMQILVHF